MKEYEDAFRHWKRALELEPDWTSAAYSMGFCYEELGEYEKAYEVWNDIIGWLLERGYEAELAFPRERANFCRAKRNKSPLFGESRSEKQIG